MIKPTHNDPYMAPSVLIVATSVALCHGPVRYLAIPIMILGFFCYISYSPKESK